MKKTEAVGHPDSLRTPSEATLADVRSKDVVTIDQSGIRAKTIEDHYSHVAALLLHEGVPERVRVLFDTSRNLYLYSWFVYRFNAVCRTYVYTCLEFALKDRFTAEWKIENPTVKGKARRPTLSELLKFAVRVGAIKNDGFEVWRSRDRARTDHRAQVEGIASETGVPVHWDPDEHDQFVDKLVQSIPVLRNQFATHIGQSSISRRDREICRGLFLVRAG